MRLVLLLVSLILFAAPAIAPAAAAPTSSEASIEDLTQTLEHDETRQQLIDRLRQDAEVAPAEEVRDISFARQLARYTQAAAEGTSAALRSLTRVGWELQRLWDGTLHADLGRLQGEIAGLVVVGIGMI